MALFNLEHAMRYDVWPQKTARLFEALNAAIGSPAFIVLPPDNQHEHPMCEIYVGPSDSICIFTLADRDAMKKWFKVEADLWAFSSPEAAFSYWKGMGTERVGRIGVYLEYLRLTGDRMVGKNRFTMGFEDFFLFENEADAVCWRMKQGWRLLL